MGVFFKSSFNLGCKSHVVGVCATLMCNRDTVIISRTKYFPYLYHSRSNIMDMMMSMKFIVLKDILCAKPEGIICSLRNFDWASLCPFSLMEPWWCQCHRCDSDTVADMVMVRGLRSCEFWHSIPTGYSSSGSASASRNVTTATGQGWVETVNDVDWSWCIRRRRRRTCLNMLNLRRRREQTQ